MDKKDIYEHLAKIYLDASSKRKKHDNKQGPILKSALIGAVLLLTAAIVFLLASPHRGQLRDTQIALVLQPETVKINFHFDPAKKEIYTIILNKLDLSRFKALSFSARKENIKDKINLRIELTTKFKERAAYYIKNIPYKWQNYKVEFLEFKGIGYLGGASSISFIVEEWNTKEKDGVVYIDNISLLK